MKSKPYVVYLVFGVTAVALWLAWHSAQKTGTGRPAPPIVAQASLPDAAVAPALNGTPVDGESMSPTVAGVRTPSSRTAPVASGLAMGPVGNAPGAALNPGESALAPNPAALIDVGRVRHMVSDYHTLMGENPVGTNAEIMKQMMGGNSHQATLGPPDGMTLNSQGELVDQWGTPYFFHQLSRDRMEVRSAGPDKVMWTADDLVTR